MTKDLLPVVFLHTSAPLNTIIQSFYLRLGAAMSSIPVIADPASDAEHSTTNRFTPMRLRSNAQIEYHSLRTTRNSSRRRGGGYGRGSRGRRLMARGSSTVNYALPEVAEWDPIPNTASGGVFVGRQLSQLPFSSQETMGVLKDIRDLLQQSNDRNDFQRLLLLVYQLSRD